MNKEQLQQICFAIDEGKEKYVRNTITHERGKVMGCAADTLDVESRGRRAYWPMDQCEETD